MCGDVSCIVTIASKRGDLVHGCMAIRGGFTLYSYTYIIFLFFIFNGKGWLHVFVDVDARLPCSCAHSPYFLSRPPPTTPCVGLFRLLHWAQPVRVSCRGLTGGSSRSARSAGSPGLKAEVSHAISTLDLVYTEMYAVAHLDACRMRCVPDTRLWYSRPLLNRGVYYDNGGGGRMCASSTCAILMKC